MADWAGATTLSDAWVRAVADRRDHLAREVVPQLEAGVHVLCDRYALSSLVYQSAAGASRELILAANAAVRRPDLTLFLSVPVLLFLLARR